MYNIYHIPVCPTLNKEGFFLFFSSLIKSKLFFSIHSCSPDLVIPMVPLNAYLRYVLMLKTCDKKIGHKKVNLHL